MTADEPIYEPTKDNLQFGGWVDSGGSVFDFDTVIVKDTVLFALWKAEVTFDMKGGTETIATQTVTENTKATEPNSPTRAGYEFAGWWLSEDDSLFNFNEQITKNTAIYAQWKLKPEIKAYSGIEFLGPGFKDKVTGTAAISIDNVPTSGDIIVYMGTFSTTIKDEADGKIDFAYDDTFLEKVFFNDGDSAEIYIEYNSDRSEKVPFTYKPYEIRVWQDLQGIRMDLGKGYTLMNSIDMPDDYNFEPLGEGIRTPFTGTLDGGGYEVNDLYIEDDTGDNVGLVGYLGSLGTIKNIGINTATDGVAGGLHVGVLAGYVNGGTVRGCYASGNVKGTGTRGNNYVGGLVGSLTNQGTLIGHAAVQVVSNDVSSAVAGGLAGYVKDSQVTGYAEGNVSGSNTTTGGLVGSSTGIVTGYATGDVDGGTAGGLVGQSTAGTVNGYATGDVTGSSEAGGLLGRIESGVSVTGYARGNLDGSGKGRVFGWSPNSETGFYSAASGESDGVSASTSNADSIDITKPGYGEDAFSQPATPGNIAFTFGTAVGEWTFITGRWPSINLPPEVGGSYKAENQPTN